MADIFRLAFIGIDHPHGSGWRDSLALLADEIELVAMVGGFGGAVASLEEKYSALPRFETVTDLLNWGHFDGAVICLPNSETPAAAIALAKAGKHILVEKPGAAGAKQWLPVVEAVQKTQVAFQAGYMWRYDEGTQRLKAMVQEGRFGKLISIQMHWMTSDIQRRGPAHYLFDKNISGGGFFNWLACHWIDLLLWITGSEVAGVFARTGTFAETHTGVEDGGSALLDLSNGCLVNFSGGYWLPRWAGESGWSIYGSQRWVHWHPSYPETSGLLEIHGPQPQFMPMEEKFSLPRDITPGYGGMKTVLLLKDWIAMARGGAPCRNTPQSLLETLAVIDAIYQSTALERKVTVG